MDTANIHEDKVYSIGPIWMFFNLRCLIYNWIIFRKRNLQIRKFKMGHFFFKLPKFYVYEHKKKIIMLVKYIYNTCIYSVHLNIL